MKIHAFPNGYVIRAEDGATSPLYKSLDDALNVLKHGDHDQSVHGKRGSGDAAGAVSGEVAQPVKGRKMSLDTATDMLSKFSYTDEPIRDAGPVSDAIARRNRRGNQPQMVEFDGSEEVVGTIEPYSNLRRREPLPPPKGDKSKLALAAGSKVLSQDEVAAMTSTPEFKQALRTIKERNPKFWESQGSSDGVRAPKMTNHLLQAMGVDAYDTPRGKMVLSPDALLIDTKSMGKLTSYWRPPDTDEKGRRYPWGGVEGAWRRRLDAKRGKNQ